MQGLTAQQIAKVIRHKILITKVKKEVERIRHLGEAEVQKVLTDSADLMLRDYPDYSSYITRLNKLKEVNPEKYSDQLGLESYYRASNRRIQLIMILSDIKKGTQEYRDRAAELRGLITDLNTKLAML